MKRLLLAIALLAVMLTACSSDIIDPQYEMVEVEGVRCIVYSAPYKGGIDCDW